MKIRGLGRGALFAAAAMGALCHAQTAFAQDVARQYDVEGTDLGEALKSVSRQSGQEVIFSSQTVAGRKSHAVHGIFTVKEAIRQLLAGTDLIAEYRDGGFVVRGRNVASDQVDNGPTATTDIVVTGSHIRGANSSPGSIISTRQDIEAQGLTDLGSFARSLLQNFSGGQNPGVQAQGNSQNLTSSSALNLRGVGPDATLTLINGHRLAYDAIAQGVDISAIPLLAVERVEVIPDGASAIYGSDAVAGVANVILRRDFSGIETAARFGASTDGGNVQQEYQAIVGRKWSSGGAVLTGDFNRATAVTAADRSYTRALNGSAALLPPQKQYALVGSAHQDLAGSIEFDVDGQFSRRTSTRSTPFSVTADATTYGNIVQTRVTTFSVSPTLRVHLPARWEASINGTYSESDARLQSRRAVPPTVSSADLAYDNKVYTVEAGAEGPLFRLPGGDARLAVGGGYRSTALRAYQITVGASAPSLNLSPSRGSYYGYAEASFPVLGPDSIAHLIRSAVINAAVRYENYPGIADITTPRVGINIDFVGGLTASGSWGRSFKAQTLFQEYQIRQATLALPTIFIGPSVPNGSTVLYVTGGNKALEPERAETWSGSLDWNPPFAKDLKLSATYFHIDYRDRVATPISAASTSFSNPTYAQLISFNPSVAAVADIVSSLSQGLSNITGAAFDPSKVGAVVDNSLRNTARQKLQGVDAEIAYHHAFNSGQRLNLTLATSYLTSDQQVLRGQAWQQLAGTIFNPPHWRGRFLGSWEQANVLSTIVVNYIGGTDDVRYAAPARVGSFATLDLVTKITAGGTGLFKGIEFTFSVINLLNEKPSIIRNTDPSAAPYDSTNYSVVGRYIGLALRKAW